jgi:hypothetical protein
MTLCGSPENRCRRMWCNTAMSGPNGTGAERAVPVAVPKNDVQTKAYGTPVP